jgi:hypothetical protein
VLKLLNVKETKCVTDLTPFLRKSVLTVLIGTVHRPHLAAATLPDEIQHVTSDF